MSTTIELGGMPLDVFKKDIKNVHLSVYPPTGRVRISVPEHMSSDAIRLFAISKLRWIKRQQQKLREQERETRREYLNRESHYVWGRRYLLRIIEGEAAPDVQLRHSVLALGVRPGAGEEVRAAVLAEWYRRQLKTVAMPLIEQWQSRLDVTVRGLFIQQMKTKWGSCNVSARTIRLNTELAKKPKECLEYLIVHELVHLIETTHGARFAELMDRFMPNWRDTRDLLNRLPARHESWHY
jgi:predicted metal-dependent hydrolase